MKLKRVCYTKWTEYENKNQNRTFGFLPKHFEFLVLLLSYCYEIWFSLPISFAGRVRTLLEEKQASQS